MRRRSRSGRRVAGPAWRDSLEYCLSGGPFVRGERVESYILMGICLVCFIGTIGIFRLLISDREQATLIGAAAGLLIAIAAGGAYYSWLATCRTCI